jgi:hypothetical protein
VMRGDLIPLTTDNWSQLQATLAPVDRWNETWAQARGTVTLNTWTGGYTVEAMGLPRLRSSQVYVGWFEGVNTLSGDPLGTGTLRPKADGSLQAELEAVWVAGPPIEYFYTLGLAYFYMADCEKSYPLFDAALQIDPEEDNALQGIRLCQESEY